MLAIKPSKKAFIILIIIAFLILLFDGYIYYNRAVRLSELTKQLDDKKIKLQESKQIVEMLESVERKYNDVQIQLSTLEQGVSKKSYIPSLLQQLERLGKQNNLVVAGIRPKPVVPPPPPPASTEDGKTATAPPPKPDPYDRIDIDIELVGKYKDITSFLDNITVFPKIIAVNQLQISPISNEMAESKNSPKLNVKLGTTAFILKTEPAPVVKNESFGVIKKIRERNNEY